MAKLWAMGSCMGAPGTFRSMFKSCEMLSWNDFKKLNEIKEGDVVMYGGGEDISPKIYQGGYAKYTTSISPTVRDKFEMAAFTAAKEKGAGNLGICRGAQMVCALSGGKLVQHVLGHAGQNHWIKDKDGFMFETSSLHHQMMHPWDVEHLLIAESAPCLSRMYVMDDKHIYTEEEWEYVEPEIVWFPKTKSLGIQGHPEMMDDNDPFVEYNRELIKEYLLP